jgi:hypothetical protein
VLNIPNDNVKNSKRILNGRLKDIFIVLTLAVILIFAVWKIFYTEDTATAYESGNVSQTETRVERLLEEIEGVGNASVMVCETEEGVQGVVVVCEGANDLQVLLNVREAVSAALGTDPKSIKIYLKKE